MMHSLKALIPDQHPLRLGWHHAKAFAAALKYGFPARKLTVIGITGTDGKTTTVGMTAHILQETGKKTGALSTAFFQIGEEIEWNATQKTSPSPFAIQAFLRRLVNEGCTHAVIEYSSHGLTQGRTDWTWPKVAAITNTTPEHLDYHGTMEEYRRAKGLLFRMLRGKGTKVLNREDETYALYSAIPSAKTISYGFFKDLPDDDLALAALNIDATPKGTTAKLVCKQGEDQEEMPLKLQMPGAFNVDNAMCAIGCATACGIALPEALKALTSFPGIPGRMERIDEGQPFSVFVDFTVTPASYQHTLATLNSMAEGEGRLLVLMGSCGDRMKEKRPLIGRIASKLADVVVVTNEDPYTEDPEKIIDEVCAGIDKAQTEAHRISDRRKAIDFLLSKAQPHDIVIFCGKGSDTTMWVKEGQIPWNEREIVREMLVAKKTA